MRISLISFLYLTCSLACCSNPDQNYDIHTAINKTLEDLLSIEQGIAGTDYYTSARTTQIQRQNPTEISWYTNTWSWKQVNFQKYPGGAVEAIFKQVKKNEAQLKPHGFMYMAGDFYTSTNYDLASQPVGWYRKSIIKYNKLEQTGIHQDPINKAAREIVCKRVYINQETPGILFATYRFNAGQQTLTVDFSYSAMPGKLDEFETYEFNERLVTE